jgi:hypothetical protein
MSREHKEKLLLQTMQVGSYIQNASPTQLKPDNSKKGRKEERERGRKTNNNPMQQTKRAHNGYSNKYINWWQTTRDPLRDNAGQKNAPDT